MPSWAEIIPAIAANVQAVNANLLVRAYYGDSLQVGTDGMAEIGPRYGDGEVNMQRAELAGRAFVYFLTVDIYVSCAVEDVAQNLMQRYMSPGDPYSIDDALSVLGALAGIAQKVIIDPSNSYGKTVVANQARFKNSWYLRVTAVSD